MSGVIFIVQVRRLAILPSDAQRSWSAGPSRPTRDYHPKIATLVH